MTPLIINLTNKISQEVFRILPAKQIWQIYPENYLKYVAAPLSGLFKARRHPKMTQKKDYRLLKLSYILRQLPTFLMDLV